MKRVQLSEGGGEEDGACCIVGKVGGVGKGRVDGVG